MTYLLESALSIKFIMTGMSGVSQVLHVGSNQHLTKLVEVTVVVIFNWNKIITLVSFKQILNKRENNIN